MLERLRGKDSDPVAVHQRGGGSILNNQTLPLDTTDEEVFRDPDDVAAMFAAPSGATLASSVYYGIKRLGADCLVAADGVASP